MPSAASGPTTPAASDRTLNNLESATGSSTDLNGPKPDFRPRGADMPVNGSFAPTAVVRRSDVIEYLPRRMSPIGGANKVIVPDATFTRLTVWVDYSDPIGLNVGARIRPKQLMYF